MAKRKSLSDVVAHAKPRTATVRLCLRGDLAQEHERLERELTETRKADDDSLAGSPQAAELAGRIQDIESEMREDETEFTFRAIGKTAWSDLIAKHPPTKDQKEMRLDHNPETFSVAAITASLVDPADATLEEVEALAEVLSIGQWGRLWSACCDANIGADEPGESSAASAVLRDSKLSSTTAASAASPAASSSAE